MYKLFASIVLLFPFYLKAWTDKGHEIVAEIAYQNLNAVTKKHVDEIVATFAPKKGCDTSACKTFSSAATLVDHIRGEGFDLFNTLHYTNFPFDPENILSSEELKKISSQNKHNDVVWIIHKSIKVLSNPKASLFSQAIMLHLLIHVAADIHQPLHCCSRYSKKHLKGDKGGNLFLIKGASSPNLHSFWDQGGGAFSALLEESSDATSSLVKRFPEKELPGVNILDPLLWSEESKELAINVAYQIEENTQPSQDYIQKVQKISSERITLAGYRLAKILNTIFSSSENSHLPSIEKGM